jgi:hypothetical protein
VISGAEPPHGDLEHVPHRRGSPECFPLEDLARVLEITRRFIELARPWHPTTLPLVHLLRHLMLQLRKLLE